ncbi:MAG: class I SAM-dependent methyltransferase, partial [Actinomycetes bacterium]
LDAALAAAPAGVTGFAGDAATFVAGLDTRFDLAESTFALHALPHEDRSAVLSALRGHVTHLALAEFDVPDDPVGSDAHLQFLADTYEQGLAEYETDRDLVAQGFLMPVLAGQLAPGAVRSTWEQPATAWAAQVRECGYRNVALEPLCDYWSSPAFLLTADA